VYDVETGQSIIKLTPHLSNTYTKNRATFNPTDELILTDGVLYDVKSGKDIHKFDKLNSGLSGVFHPNGLEVSRVMEAGIVCGTLKWPAIIIGNVWIGWPL